MVWQPEGGPGGDWSLARPLQSRAASQRFKLFIASPIHSPLAPKARYTASKRLTLKRIYSMPADTQANFFARKYGVEKLFKTLGGFQTAFLHRFFNGDDEFWRMVFEWPHSSVLISWNSIFERHRARDSVTLATSFPQLLDSKKRFLFAPDSYKPNLNISLNDCKLQPMLEKLNGVLWRA